MCVCVCVCVCVRACVRVKKLKPCPNIFFSAVPLAILLYTVELQWLEHLLDHRKLFETWVVRATEG